MTDLKISALTAGNALTPGDLFPVARSGSTLAVNSLSKIFDHTITGSTEASFDTGAGGVPSGFLLLRLILILRGDVAAGADNTGIRFNNDSASHYDWQRTNGNNGSVVANFTSLTTGIFSPRHTGSTATANRFSQYVIDIAGYDETTRHKTISGCGGFNLNDASSGAVSDQVAGTWNQTSAITRIQVVPASGNYVTNSRVIILGLF